MNCRYCGSPLQPGALFCVECGRSVAEAPAPPSAPVPPARATAAPGAAPVTGPAAPTESAPAPPSVAPGASQPEVSASTHCPQCGAAIDAVDIFCGECGFVLRPMTEVAERGIESSVAKPQPEPGPMPESTPQPPQPAPHEVPSESADRPPVEDIERTRMMASRARGERYVLQFSTGESVVVAGNGLIGRNPAPEPGEYVDELVAIFDVGKSVSKSHVEFGQESGRFWVSDRYSTNGTVVRQPDTDPVRCEPGKRYMIARGSRVEIGEQFFIVS